MDSSNADPWEGFTGESQADADDAQPRAEETR